MNVQIDTLVSARRTHLDLFSGIGGFALAAQWAGFETVAFCEIDEYPRKVLEKNFPGVPIHQDIKELDGNEYAGIELLTGGFPCQPFSNAGKQGGKKDDRYLWPEMLRVITQSRPAWVVAENVPGIIPMALDEVLSSLESEGYTARTLIIPACGVNAQHIRERTWIVANAGSRRHRQQCEREQRKKDSGNKRELHQWETEPGTGRVANGIPCRVDRLKALGNAIVPQVAYEILRAISAH